MKKLSKENFQKTLKSSLKNFQSFCSAVKWCFGLTWKTSKFYTIIRILIDIITPLIAIAAAFIGKNIIDLLSGTDINWFYRLYSNYINISLQTSLFILLGLLATLSILRLGLQKITQYSQSMQSELINCEISIDMMTRISNADLEHFDNPEYYDRLQSATQDTMIVSHIVWNVMSSLSATVSFIGAFVVLIASNPIYGFLMIAAAIPASIAAARYTKLIYMLSLEQVNEHRQMYYCQYMVSEKRFAQELRLFDAGEMLIDKYRRIWQNLFVKRKGITRKRTVSTGLLECLPELIVIYIGIDIALGILGNRNTVGDYVLFTGMATQLRMAISMFTNSSLQIYDNKLKIENIRKLDNFSSNIVDNDNNNDIGTEPLVNGAESKPLVNGTEPLINSINTIDTIDTIEFKNVSFTYPNTSVKALDNINFTLNKNEKVVLVGLNGSGKSTLIKLLLRMYEPSSGSILINGKNIRDYKLKDLRANFSVYFQDMFNFNFTLRENFTIADGADDYAKDNIDDNWNKEKEHKAYEALKNAFALDIIEKTSKGMETSITRLFDPNGIELSGGQHQKLALARALYRRNTALILDEPASNLDPLAEHEIFNALKTLTDGKMTIFTSHRLSNVSLADRILVLEKGCIIEDGTQEDLLKNKNRYAELFGYQKEKYLGN